MQYRIASCLNPLDCPGVRISTLHPCTVISQSKLMHQQLAGLSTGRGPMAGGGCAATWLLLIS